MPFLRWTKLGKIFSPCSELAWMRSHAMVPTAFHLSDDRYRIYFSGRDVNNRSHIGFFDVDLAEPSKILAISKKPALVFGELGCFDDSGVTPSCVVRHAKGIYLYYIGWNQRSSVRMSLIAGLAKSENGGKTFERVSRGPLLERTDREPFAILTAPCVLLEKGLWKMWYVSGTGWLNPDLPTYNIKYATSRDGIHWKRDGHVCIPLRNGEHALARPYVFVRNGEYQMWYSYKGKNYRIGYAESSDGVSWVRQDDKAGIQTSSSGWDSQMIEYACVVEHAGKKFMFYNGNDYGKEGIGLAVCEKETSR